MLGCSPIWSGQLFPVFQKKVQAWIFFRRIFRFLNSGHICLLALGLPDCQPCFRLLKWVAIIQEKTQMIAATGRATVSGHQRALILLASHLSSNRLLRDYIQFFFLTLSAFSCVKCTKYGP